MCLSPNSEVFYTSVRVTFNFRCISQNTYGCVISRFWDIMRHNLWIGLVCSVREDYAHESDKTLYFTHLLRTRSWIDFHQVCYMGLSRGLNQLELSRGFYSVCGNWLELPPLTRRWRCLWSPSSRQSRPLQQPGNGTWSMQTAAAVAVLIAPRPTDFATNVTRRSAAPERDGLSSCFRFRVAWLAFRLVACYCRRTETDVQTDWTA